MIIEQIYTGCLAEAAYYIESNGQAAIIDPLREVAPYIDMAQKRNATIKYVLETHFHADFVSGHLDLANKTGATIVYGPTALPNFEAHIAADGELLPLGNVTIQVLHTPGHTMESSTFLLLNEAGAPHAVFTGDTLFIGDVGRPDLAVKTDLSREDLAGHLYRSLRNKIMPLPNEVMVYPGHGAGSACGKKMSQATSDTLGNQKRFNYALRANMTEAEFIAEVTDGLVTPPQYFPKNAVMNKMGYHSIDAVLQQGMQPLAVSAMLHAMANQHALVLDTRSKAAFAEQHIPGSIWIGLEDNFAPWVGALIEDLQQPIVFLAAPGLEQEVVTRLSRVGYDNALGYLQGGIEAWQQSGQPTTCIQQCSATEFAHAYQPSKASVLDVRKFSEYNAQHLEGAQNVPLDFLQQNLSQLNSSHTYYLHCQGGYRSVIAASILKANGFHNIINVLGGFQAIKKVCPWVTAYAEPQTHL